jgi:mono/diheme cytochrome c family protein
MSRLSDIARTGNCKPCEDCGGCDPGRAPLKNSRGALRLWSPWTFVIVLLPAAFLSWLFLRPLLWPALTAQELHGKQIYFEGNSPAGAKIIAYVGADKVQLPGSAATCASCHGPDGRGRPEAGVIPSDITWSHLTKRYGHSHPMGRKHPAFTEATLKRSILNGNDPAGNRLDASMPTYAMSAEDINALIAYMKRLQKDFDPGLAEKSIRIGTLLPASGRTAATGQAMSAVIAAYFEEINTRGGIYNRKLRLIVSPYDATRQADLRRAPDGQRKCLCRGRCRHCRRGPADRRAGRG